MPDHGKADHRRPRRDPSRAGDQRLLRQAGWLVLAVAVIGTSLFAGSLVFGGPSRDPSVGSPTITPMTSAPPSSSTSSPTPTSSPTAGPTEAGMTAFVSDYLAAVADDPATAWGNLTPGFQRTSGGFEKYRTFWAPIQDAVASNVRADPTAQTVSYDVRYTYADGRTTRDSTRLTLSYEDGTYRISGEG